MEFDRKEAMRRGDCGKCGQNMRWYYLDGTLYLEGMGRLRCTDKNWPRLKNRICHVILAPGCTAIADFTFLNHMNLETVVLPDTLRTIGERVFRNCQKLRAIVIPDSVTGIGKGAFDGCVALERVQLPRNLSQIHDETFRGCHALRDVRIPNSVHYIGQYAFWNVHSINNLPSCLDVRRMCRYEDNGWRHRDKSGIGECAFGNVKEIKNCVIPDHVTKIGQNAFLNVPHITYHGRAQSDDNWGAKSRN